MRLFTKETMAVNAHELLTDVVVVIIALKESSLKIRDWTLFSFHESELERPLLFVFYFDYVTRSFLI